MYIRVQLLTGYREFLWYVCPPEWDKASLIGALVRVPLRKQHVPALVLAKQHSKPDVPFALRSAVRLEPVPDDPHYYRFISLVSTYYQIAPTVLIKRMKQFLFQKEVATDSVHASLDEKAIDVQLTHEQQAIVEALLPTISEPTFTPTILHGVTGSGKTEVYKELIKKAYAEKKSSLFLVPEVTLSLAFEKRLQKELPHLPIIGFHSATSIKEKRLLWQLLLDKKPVVIVGVHLPILLPISNLGIIIVDEEHDPGYQEKKHPKINSKEAALIRAKQVGIPIILGSATPSISSLYNVKQRKWQFFQLLKRFAGSFPTVKIVFLNDKKQRKNFWISTELYRAIADRLSKKEQTIIFLNRRGHSFFVQCKGCSNIIMCPSCSVSLTRHSTNTMHCHYCEYHIPFPKECPACREKEFLKKGIGTQQVVSIIETLFPDARIARADLDTTKKKKEWHTTLQGMQDGTIDILIGTQTITKGYHFPRVTLVGILWADLNLHFPRYNAAETTLQQLIQVAGRAGRQSDESLVIVQTMDHHPVFSFLQEETYLSFYEDELKTRSLLSYPPCKRLVELELKHTNESTLHHDAHLVAATLDTIVKRSGLDIQILGPAMPPVHKVKNWHYRTIYVKAHTITELLDLHKAIASLRITSLLFFHPNPLG